MSAREPCPAGGHSGQRLSLWLATPQGRRHFDAQALSAHDRDRWMVRARAGNQLEFEVSRALLAASPWGAGSVTSLSHSAGHAVVAAAPAGSRIGVDLEFIEPRNAEALGEFAYSSAEAQALAQLDAAERLRHFHLLWVFKEACIKALGLSLVEGLRNCTLRRERGIWRAGLPTTARWQLTIHAPRPDALLALLLVGPCAAERPDPLLYEWPPQARADWPLVLRAEGGEVTGAVVSD